MIKSCKSKKEKKKGKNLFCFTWTLQLYSKNPETNSWLQSNKTYSEHMP